MTPISRDLTHRLRHWLVLLLFAAALCAPVLAEEGEALPPVHLPVFTDLKAVGEEAAARRLPILLMFSQDGCGY